MLPYVLFFGGILVGFLLASFLRGARDPADHPDVDRWIALVFSGWRVEVPTDDGTKMLSGHKLEQEIDRLLDRNN